MHPGQRAGRSTHGAIVVVAMLAGCLPKPPKDSQLAPAIAVRPGVAQRLALMDRFRLHDEERKLMMARPSVWVEEVPDDEMPDAEAGEADAEGRATSLRATP
jgi:hypothetical protein